MDANVYEHSSQRQSNPSAAITHTASTDSLTHFLEEPVCTLALSDIFNLQDGFVAFVCHRFNGPELRALWLWLILLFSCRVTLPNLLGKGNNKSRPTLLLGRSISQANPWTKVSLTFIGINSREWLCLCPITALKHSLLVSKTTLSHSLCNKLLNICAHSLSLLIHHFWIHSSNTYIHEHSLI